jgi:hypothetical protein
MNINATNFDLANARACAQASADAYRQSTVSDPATDTHCLVMASPDYVVVAFRGTNSIRNWITDARFERTELSHRLNATPDCKVHAGFLAAFDSIIGPLSDYLKKVGCCARDGRGPIFITGHSLGGALAILAVTALRPMYNVAQVYTFGQPRVGNAAFKRLYEAGVQASACTAVDTLKRELQPNTFRLVYQEDIVPRVPHLPAWNDPYRHVGTEVFVPSLNLATGQTLQGLWFDPPWWRLLLSDAWGIYRAFCISKFAGALDPMMDHRVENYQQALAAIVDDGADGTNQAGPGPNIPPDLKLAGEPPALQLHL